MRQRSYIIRNGQKNSSTGERIMEDLSITQIIVLVVLTSAVVASMVCEVIIKINGRER